LTELEIPRQKILKVMEQSGPGTGEESLVELFVGPRNSKGRFDLM
jgi:hypothetical protein